MEHPYQIIEYNGMLGIQIGTLIVTKDMSVDKKGGYAIETHSHPVVSYFNKQESLNQRKQNSMSVQRPFEGVVWDKVELYELSVLAREGERMSWRNYMSYCRKLRLGELEGTIKDAELLITNTYGQLLDWGIDMLVPGLSKDGEYILNVEWKYKDAGEMLSVDYQLLLQLSLQGCLLDRKPFPARFYR